MKTLRVLYSSLALQMKYSFARPTFKFIVILQPVFYSILFYFMFKHSGKNPGEYIVIGTGIMNLWSVIVFSSAGDIERERFHGTLETLYITQTDFKIIFLGKIIGNLMFGFFSMTISYFIIKNVFHISVSLKNPYLFVLSLVFTMISFMAVSLLLAGLFTVTRNSRLFMNCSEYPIFILCGVIFPISKLPKFFQSLSYLLPPTWSVKILRMSMDGIESVDKYISSIFFISALSAFYFVISLYFFHLVETKTRVEGSLGMY